MTGSARDAWSWNQRIMKMFSTLWALTFVTKLAWHMTDAVSATTACPKVCHCQNGYSHCRQGNLTYVPQGLYRYTVTLDVGKNRIFTVANASFETIPNLEILEMDSNRISYIERRAFSNVRNLKILVLKDNRISSLPKDLFSSNRKLEVLDLSQNALYYLPQEAINRLFNLQVLNVSHNYISSAYLGHNFRDTTHLQHLDLSFNNIPRLEEEDFLSVAWWETGMPHQLNLSNCNIRNIQRDALKELSPLSSLTLSHNPKISIHSLTVAIRDLPTINLETLNLANVSIHNLGNILRDGKFSQLLHLDLSRNFLERITTGSLYTLENLQSLDLSRNSISQIEGFNGLNNLKVLNLNQNRLVRIDFSFDGLQTLRELHLAHNRLSRLDSQPFESLWDLELLDITHNAVSNVNIKFGFENIRYLYMAHNELTDIVFLQSLPHVTTLDASFNRIGYVSTEIFSRAQMITAVNLSHNDISRIDPTTFALSTLTRIDLSFNRLEQLTHFGWKSPLKELYLHHNNITYIAPNALQGLTTLETLDISNCGLYGFPLNTFADLHFLTILNISYNNVGLFLSSPKAQLVFQAMERLETLDLSHCQLSEFPQCFATSSKTLQKINLCCNDISKLSKDSMAELVTLNSLNLAQNQIANIDPTIFSDLISLENIDMSQNPYSCSCDLKPLCDWFKSTEVNIQGLYTSKQAYSCQPKGADTLEISHFCSTMIAQECDAKTKKYLWIIIAVVTSITLLITVVLICKYCHRKRKRKLKRRAGQTIALQNSCKDEGVKMMTDTCRYTCDGLYKEDML